jgi:glycosyltransferase involved in cell wall biosynthesis
MKVLYISGPSFLDMDLSFVSALGKRADCYYLMDLYPKLRKATALSLEQAPTAAEIIPMSQFPGMEGFSPLLQLDRCFVINRTSNNPLARTNLALQYKLFRFIKQLDPDVIHFNNQIYFTHFYLFAWFRRVLISIHDPFPHSGEEADSQRLSVKVYQYLNNRFIRYHLLYNEVMVEAYAQDRHINADRVLTSSLGPYEYLRLMNDEAVSTTCDFLIFGRIQKYKGIDLLLEAFLKVLETHPGATLTIAGSGTFWFNVADYGIPNKNLRIINRFIPGDELASLLKGAKVVVCPYRDATQSGVVMSAYAFHKPVIVTNVGALSQVVEDGKSGFIVEPNDAEALAEAMRRTLGDDQPLKQAPEYIDEVYHQGEKSWSAITQRMVVTYRKVLGLAG